MSGDQNLIAMNMKYGAESVQYFYKQGKLTQQQFQNVSTLIKQLFKVISDSQKNYNTLNQTMRILKKQLTTIKHQHQLANNRQTEVTQTTQKLSRAFKKAESDYEIQKTKYEGQIYEAQNKEKQVMNSKQRMDQNIRSMKQKMQPVIERYNADIQQTRQLNQKTKNNIETLQKQLEENMLKIKSIKNKNIQLSQEEQRLKQIQLKIKDSPDHYAKSAENLHIQIIGMQNELKQTKQQIERKMKICNTFSDKNKNQEEQIDRLQKQKEQTVQQTQQIKHETQQIRNQNHILDTEKQQIKIDVMIKVDLQIHEIKQNIKMTNQIINEYKKQCQKLKKTYKKQDIKKKQFQEFILQTQMVIQKIKKQQVLIQTQTQELISRSQNMKDDIIIVSDKTQSIKLKSSSNQNKKKQIENEIRKMENTLAQLKKIVSNINKEIKDSTAVRQSMARKASVANSEVRQTQEELKVKQLLILDLTKKQEETQNKLEHFKALYEQVKSARNKYVNLIQNSSQDLAQLKERIKILQNELQILKNQSSEKHKTIQDYNHIKQLQVHKRDQTKAKLNQYELEKRQKKQLVDQNINEIQKLNMIILSLQKDMQNLRQQYEEACQNRNYTGIQLIDRNDQLCILYEKSNIQQNILRKSEVAVKNLEDDIRMIKIQINEYARKIKVSQEKLSTVPQYAEQLLELQRSIQDTHLRESDLSTKLEDPENKERWRELGGQDPDQEALDAKISILEERLNGKKEQLLEKQLILDQVTNLSEKLKKDAVEGRQSTLQVSQKINQFQSRLRDLTRKMKATISELSMCQANIIKYQNQRDDFQGNYEDAKKRMEEGLPPTPETQIQYLKMIRDKKRYEEERGIRKQKDILEMNYPPYATKTTAQARHNSYIPPDQIGLPKPYGNNAPFMFHQPGSNMRHFKKPKIKQIQI